MTEMMTGLQPSAIADGDAAFAEIVRRHGPMVYAVARRRTGQDADAADVTQAVFVALARKRKSVDARFLAGWLMRATAFAARAHGRAAGRRAVRERRAARLRGETMPDDSAAVDSDLLDALDAALLTLGDADRSAVIDRVVHGQSFAEIAAATGVSADAVRKRVARAIARLHGELGVGESAVTAALAGGFVVPVPASLTASCVGVAKAQATAGAGTKTAWAMAKWPALAAGGLAIGAAAIVATRPAPPPRQPPAITATLAATSPAPTARPSVAPPTAVSPVESGDFVDPPLSPGPTPGVRLPNPPEAANANTVALLADGQSYFVGGGTLNFTGPEDARHYTGRFYAAVHGIGETGPGRAATGDGFPIYSGAVTPDGRRAVFSMIEWNTHGHLLRVADLAGPDAGKSWPLGESKDGWADAVAITDDGRLAASTNNGTTIAVWDLVTQKHKTTLDAGRKPGVLAFDHAGRRLVSAQRINIGEGPVRLWSLADGTSRVLAGPSGNVKAIAVSRDDSRIAVLDADGSLWRFDAATAVLVWRRTLPVGEIAQQIAFSPDGRWLAVGSDAARPDAPADQSYIRRVTLRVFDAAAGTAVARVSNVEREVRAIAFTPDGRELLTEQNGHAYRWPLPDLAGRLFVAPKPPTTTQSVESTAVALAPPRSVLSVAMAADGRAVFVGSFGVGLALDWPGGRVRTTFSRDQTVQVVRPDLGRALITGTTKTGGFAAVVEMTTAKEIVRFAEPALPFIDAVAYSPDGRFVALAAGTRPGQVSPVFTPEIGVFDVETGQRLWRNTADAADVRCLAFSPDGTRLIAGGGRQDGVKPVHCRVRTLDVLTGERVAADRAFDRPVVSVVPSPDGLAVWACGNVGPVVGWDAATGRTIADSGSLPIDGLSSDDTPLAISPDGRTLAAGCADSNVYLIDAATGRVFRRLTDAAAGVSAVAFSPDGTRLIAADRQAVRAWATADVARR